MAAFDRFVHSAWAYAALAVFVFLAAAPGLVSMPTLDRDEARFAQASSQMLETGDFVVIRFHDELRNKKPAGLHWLQAVAVGTTSSAEARDISAFRLPSLAGAIIAAMATMWGGAALFNRRAAFIGAALFGSCLLLTSEAHIGKTDAMLVGVVTLAMASVAWMRRGAGRYCGLLFWVSIAASVLLKGPVGLMVAASAIAALLLWERKFEWARPLIYWLGLSLFVIMTVPWFIAVQIATDGAFIAEAATLDLGAKIVGATEYHSGPPGMHLAALPVLFWPGTLFLAAGLWLGIGSLLRRPGAQLVRKGGDQAARKTADAVAKAWTEQEAAAWRFIACWIVPSWLIFEFMPTKLVHYTLPLYPALALAAGAAADKWFSAGAWKGGRWASLILFAVAGGLVAGLTTPWVLNAVRADAAAEFGAPLADRVTWEWSQDWIATGIGLWPAILIALAAISTGAAFIRKMPLATLAGVLVCSLIAGVSYRNFVLPGQTWMLSTPAALSALNEICAAPEGSAQWIASGCEGRGPREVRVIAYAEPSLVFELSGRVTIPPKSSAALPSVADDPRPAWLIDINQPQGREALAAITTAAASADRCVRLARRHVVNYSNGFPLILVAAVVEAADCPTTDPWLDEPVEQEPEPELTQ